MDAKVFYWTGALVNLAVIVVLQARGISQIRRGEVARHRRSMLTAAWLVAAFLVSYVFKLGLLGREDLSLWNPFYVLTLRFHESCVLAMVAAGAFALSRARKMRGTRNVTRDPVDDPAPASTVLWHHRAGWVAVLGAVTGLLSAAVVLVGMYLRL